MPHEGYEILEQLLRERAEMGKVSLEPFVKKQREDQRLKGFKEEVSLNLFKLRFVCMVLTLYLWQLERLLQGIIPFILSES